MKFADNIPSYDSTEFQRKFIANDNPIFGRKEAVKIVKIQDVIGYMKFPLPLHRTNYYDIMFISKGQQASRHCGLKKHEITSSQILFKAAGQITSGDVIGKDIEGYFCMIEEDFMSNSGLVKSSLRSLPFFKHGNNPVVTLNSQEVERVDFLLSNLHQLYQGNEGGSKNSIIVAYLNTLLEEALAIHQKQNPASPDRTHANTAEVLVDKFKDLVAEHYLIKRQVKDYADLLFVTPNHLNKVIRKTIGRTALDLISEMLLMEAEILLKQTTMSVAEISFYLNFDDISYFIRFFKKQKGITPGGFRKLTG